MILDCGLILLSSGSRLNGADADRLEEKGGVGTEMLAGEGGGWRSKEPFLPGRGGSGGGGGEELCDPGGREDGACVWKGRDVGRLQVEGSVSSVASVDGPVDSCVDPSSISKLSVSKSMYSLSLRDLSLSLRLPTLSSIKSAFSPPSLPTVTA